ncbi:MICOS complex subunit MIC25 isoform X2 [Desmodus rotundus]|uniref:MICOS complex subunit MIC25 isoform X2 n=1 Tax=Desmodus rotundus TaxID=9430 RepID=UPI0023818F7B|nr:MICOS complex subunit MIC25 isoform X1 [Desmodus rotundus]
MGGTESSENRRVTFGMDEKKRVRVLQGIRLSENVVNRMKDSNYPSKVGQLTFPPAPPPSTFGTSEGLEKDSKLPMSEYGDSQPPSGVEADLLKRYKQEQAVVQDELYQVVMREREAATKYHSAFLHRVEGSVDQENQKSALLNAEMYKLSSQQFHEAASKMEGTIKVEKQQLFLTLAMTWSPEEGTSYGTADPQATAIFCQMPMMPLCLGPPCA